MHYITIQDQFKLNGDRHLERAIAYASAQYPDRYFEGSMRKAISNYKKADEFKFVVHIERMFIFKEINERITFSIMNGSDNWLKCQTK